MAEYMSGIAELEAQERSNGGFEGTSVGKIGRVFIVFVDGAWLRPVEVGVFDFLEFDHHDFFSSSLSRIDECRMEVVMRQK